MLSRVANNIYWMARYIERAENTARLVNVNTHLLLDLPKKVRLGWAPIVDIVSARDLFYSKNEQADEKSVIRFLVIDLENSGSILSSLQLARENARTIRDIIPREAWEQVNELYLIAKTDASQVLTYRHRYVYLRNLILGAQTITGLLAGTTTHDEGYAFLRMGRNLERADMTTRIIDVRSASLLPQMSEDLTPFENIQWMGVLKSLTAYQMYRRAVRLRVRRPDVLKFLFQETRFPRSVSHCLGEVESCLKLLPKNEKPLKLIEQLQRRLHRSDVKMLDQANLHEYIDELQLGIIKFGNSVSDTYF